VAGTLYEIRTVFTDWKEMYISPAILFAVTIALLTSISVITFAVFRILDLEDDVRVYRRKIREAGTRW